jgi:hypothetical protein
MVLQGQPCGRVGVADHIFSGFGRETQKPPRTNRSRGLLLFGPLVCILAVVNPTGRRYTLAYGVSAMRKGLGLVIALASCKSDGGIGSNLIDYGPLNPRDLETPVNIDRLVQTTVPIVDMLFVVDNSCSMLQEQAVLAANFPALLEWFLGSGLDYHIGVVSTDINDPLHAGRLRSVSEQRWIQEDTESPEAVFDEMVSMGTTGHWSESGRAAAFYAIEPPLVNDENLGFVRDDAALHTIVVSDENDESGDSPVSRPEWITYLQTSRWSAQMVSFSSIVGPLAGCPDIGAPGTEYTSVTAAVGGVTWPICSDDWTEVLDELGFVATGLSREFFLSQLPVPDTIEVHVDDEGTVREFFEGADWEYSPIRNSIQFHEFVPDPLSVVEIEYLVFASLDEPVTPPDDPPGE